MSVVNQQTIIGLEETTIIGQKPLRYFVNENPRPETKDYTSFGSLKGIPSNDPSARAKPTRLNELDATYKLPFNHGYMASEVLSRKDIDESTSLRFGGSVRPLKSEQGVGEQTAHRYNFIAPFTPIVDDTVVDGTTYESKPLIMTDTKFHTANYGKSQPIPNYEAVGNNPVMDNYFGVGTRGGLIENRRFK